MKLNKQPEFSLDALLRALTSYFGEVITDASKTITNLQGGTVANVCFVQGTAKTLLHGELPYKIIWKHTKKWNRPGDPLSWRREYDWIHLNQTFDLGIKLKMPKWYHREINDEENHLWLEYIEGVSGSDLTLSMLEETAFQWGEFQGRCSWMLGQIVGGNLTDISFLDSELSQWYHNPYDYAYLCSDQCKIPSFVKNTLRQNSWNDGRSIVYHYLRSEVCDLPSHLKQMIINLDESKDKVFTSLSKLPKVISHRDLWIENIFYTEAAVYLIDWDCVGIGYLGEDLASLIADDTSTNHLSEYFNRLFNSYKKGFSIYNDSSLLEPVDIVNMILIKYGYRLVDNYWFTDSNSEKEDIVNRLSIFYSLLYQQTK